MKYNKILLMLLIIANNSFADVYNDPNFDERKIVGEGEPSIWLPFEPKKGTLLHLQQLVPEHWNVYPFAWDGKGIAPKNVNYWSYFDKEKYTCRGAYAKVWEAVKGCEEETSNKEKVKVEPIPELPSSIYMLIGGVFCFFIALVKGKRVKELVNNFNWC